MSPAYGHSVFVSYAGEDRALADRVSERLRRDGIRVWQYTESAESGSWHLNQIRALRDSKVAIFLITESSAGSSACLDEAQRVADPDQLDTVAIPVVVGAWRHESSDLWLLLSKWNGVIASPELDDEALHRLAGLVHSRLGTRPTSSLSTGQALSAVKDDLCLFLDTMTDFSSSAVLHKAHDLQLKHRGNMVAFAQFTYLDRELRAAELLAPSARAFYIRQYLEAFFDGTVTSGHADVARRLASHIQMGETVVISEYSRVIKQAMKIVSDSDPRLFKSLQFIVVGRTGMLLMAGEPARMVEDLRAMGAEPRIIAFDAWIDYLYGGEDRMKIGQVDKLLFGVEAFSVLGDIVYPQIVKELDLLRTRATVGGPIRKAVIIAAGESFKVCRDHSEVTKMVPDPHYTVMPISAVDLIVTDIGEFVPDSDGRVDLTPCTVHVSAEADEIRSALWPTDSPLPVWNLSTEIRRTATVLVTDIDGSITSGAKLSLEALTCFERLDKAGRKIVLTTGRSAGWASALAHYLPGVFAVIAENGAVLIDRAGGDSAPLLLDGWEAAELRAKMQPVEDCLSAVLSRIPNVVPSPDNYTRLTDRAFKVSDELDPLQVAPIATAFGVRYTYSTVHHHLSCSAMDKSSGLTTAMRDHLDLSDVVVSENVITVGDSFNDAPLFDRTMFAAAVGVRGVLRHLDRLGPQLPGYVTLADASDGFVELANLLLTR
jgi:HAD superfamily hydrolase (TIGR01484 family)